MSTLGCYAKEILGNKINEAWLYSCHKRANNHICCKFCNRRTYCGVACNRVLRECFYLTTKEEIPLKKMLLQINPSVKGS